MQQTSQRGLTANTLKIFAIVAMTIDHIAWLAFPLYAPLGQLAHFIGRMTIPIMAYFVAEGFYHTRNFWRYAGRLALFALLSQLPFTFYMAGRFTLSFYGASVIYTLLLGLLALALLKQDTLHPLLRILGVLALLFLSTFGDWSYYAILWVLAFGLLRERRLLSFACAAGVTLFYFAQVLISGGGLAALPQSLFTLGGLAALALLWFYNGQRGTLRMKYLFYIYYPLHLVLVRWIFMQFYW